MSDERGVATAAAWWDDPTGRFDQRYHNGVRWTADVALDGVRYVDPLPEAPGPGGPPPDRDARNGRAVAALVLGIVGMTLGWLPYVFAVGAVASLLAVFLGVRELRRARGSGAGRAASTAGTVTGGVGLVVAVVGLFFTLAFEDARADYDAPAEHRVEVTECSYLRPRWTALATVENLSSAEADFTVRIGFVRPGTDNVRLSDTVVVDGVSPGEVRTIEAAGSIDDESIDCVVLWVRGPRPFGFDPE